MSAARVQALQGRLGPAAAADFLAKAGVHYQLVPHKRTFTAVDEATASGVPPEHEIKTLVLRTGRALVRAALPASEMLDLEKARGLLGDDDARLADEPEIAAAFPLFELGAIPPIGPARPPLALFDERLVKYSRVVCAGGDHRHAFVVIPAEILAAAKPVIGDICRERRR